MLYVTLLKPNSGLGGTRKSSRDTEGPFLALAGRFFDGHSQVVPKQMGPGASLPHK